MQFAPISTGQAFRLRALLVVIRMRAFWLLFLVSLALPVCAATNLMPGFLPGQRVLLDAHNCYPYEGQWTNRLERALATGTPLGIEVDLIWHPLPTSGSPRIVVRHGGQARGNEPTLEAYFFERVRPIIETALASTNRSQWPLITLNVNDLRASDPEFFTALWKLTGTYEQWLCTAPKASTLGPPTPLELKPILVLTSDGALQRRIFYDEVPVGGRLRMFAAGKPERDADNFCRWLNYDWKAVEPEGQPRAGAWTADDTTRLTRIVDNAHQRGYWVRFYTLNGHGLLEAAVNGWSPGYNFGSVETAALRWQAARAAGVDFIAADQYEDCAKALRGK